MSKCLNLDSRNCSLDWDWKNMVSGLGPTKFGDKNAFSIKIQHVHLSDSALRWPDIEPQRNHLWVGSLQGSYWTSVLHSTGISRIETVVWFDRGLSSVVKSRKILFTFSLSFALPNFQIKFLRKKMTEPSLINFEFPVTPPGKCFKKFYEWTSKKINTKTLLCFILIQWWSVKNIGV